MVTLSDVAREAGVSPMTVSNSLRGKPNVSAKTRAHVHEVAARMGYRVNVVAQGLRSGRTGAIALAVPELDMPFPAHYAAEVTAAAAKHGIRVIVQQTHSEKEAELAAIRDSAGGLVDGTIISALGMTDAEIEQAAHGRAVVLMDERVGEPHLDVICSPNYDGAKAAAKHLVEQGCSRIIALGGDLPAEGETELTGAHLRLAGLRDGLREAGAGFGDAQVVHCTWDTDSARETVRALIDSGYGFDGIFAMTDSVALGAIRGLADRDIDCPRQVKVIGFDGIREGDFSVPSLSTIDVDKRFLAEQAVRMLLERIENRGEPAEGRKVVAPFTLIQRESTS